MKVINLSLYCKCWRQIVCFKPNSIKFLRDVVSSISRIVILKSINKFKNTKACIKSKILSFRWNELLKEQRYIIVCSHKLRIILILILDLVWISSLQFCVKMGYICLQGMTGEERIVVQNIYKNDKSKETTNKRYLVMKKDTMLLLNLTHKC